MVTIEYHVTFNKIMGEFALNLIGQVGSSYFINDSHQHMVIETDLEEREFLYALSQLADVESIGYIKTVRHLEPDWSVYA
jgi:hypothetical protein